MPTPEREQQMEQSGQLRLDASAELLRVRAEMSALNAQLDRVASEIESSVSEPGQEEQVRTRVNDARALQQALWKDKVQLRAQETLLLCQLLGGAETAAPIPPPLAPATRPQQPPRPQPILQLPQGAGQASSYWGQENVPWQHGGWQPGGWLGWTPTFASPFTPRPAIGAGDMPPPPSRMNLSHSSFSSQSTDPATRLSFRSPAATPASGTRALDSSETCPGRRDSSDLAISHWTRDVATLSPIAQPQFHSGGAKSRKHGDVEGRAGVPAEDIPCPQMQAALLPLNNGLAAPAQCGSSHMAVENSTTQGLSPVELSLNVPNRDHLPSLPGSAAPGTTTAARGSNADGTEPVAAFLRSRSPGSDVCKAKQLSRDSAFEQVGRPSAVAILEEGGGIPEAYWGEVQDSEALRLHLGTSAESGQWEQCNGTEPLHLKGGSAVQHGVTAGVGWTAVWQPPGSSYPVPSASVESHGTEKEGVIVNPGGYSVCRGSKSVRDVWNEWRVGLKGGPPVEKLEELRREGRLKEWWATPSDHKYWSKQMRIVQAVQKKAGELGGNVEASLEFWEDGLASRFKGSLNQLRNFLGEPRETKRALGGKSQRAAQGQEASEGPERRVQVDLGVAQQESERDSWDASGEPKSKTPCNGLPQGPPEVLEQQTEAARGEDHSAGESAQMSTPGVLALESASQPKGEASVGEDASAAAGHTPGAFDVSSSPSKGQESVGGAAAVTQGRTDDVPVQVVMAPLQPLEHNSMGTDAAGGTAAAQELADGPPMFEST